MESILIRSVLVLYPDSPWNGKKVDVLLERGKIKAIKDKGKIAHQGKTLSGKDQVLVPGFFDMHANFGEPGMETKEDMQTGCQAALHGGFTGLALAPNTRPALHSKAEIKYIRNLAKDQVPEVYPIGAISKDRAGKDLAELYDMQQNGAVAFSDGNHAIQQAELMSRSLLYCKGFGGLIIAYADDTSLSGNAKMNEGLTSTLLGMKGMPSLSEEVMVARDLYLAEYNDAPIHFTTISTAGSVRLIKEAKKKGLQVTCDVAAHHLFLNETALSGYDSLYKVKPPLRTEADRKALIKGLKEGTIDAIVSQHTPHEQEYKQVEFEIAHFGMTGLQTAFSLACQCGLSLDMIVEKMAIRPREILKLPKGVFDTDAAADFILVNPDEIWIFEERINQSKSKNSPFLNKEMKGKVNFLAHKNQYFSF